MGVVILGLMAGCGTYISGSGDLVNEPYDLSGFQNIEIHDGFQVEITKSSSFSVEVTIDDNARKYLVVEVVGDTLHINLDRFWVFGSLTRKAVITMPNIESIDLSGGSRCEITGFTSGEDFSASLSGGSRLTGDLRSSDMDLNLSGGSRVELVGSGKNLKIESSGGSTVTLDTFPVADADINISGGGKTYVNLSGKLDADLSGGSQVIYTGQPELGDIQMSGGSTIRSN